MNTVQPIRDTRRIFEIADYLRGKRERDYILFMTGIYTGLRISDILPLTVADVKSACATKGDAHLYIREKKTRKEKRIPINKNIKQILNEYIEGKSDWDYLFPSQQLASKTQKRRSDGYLTRQRAYQILREAGSRFGLEDVGTHTLRKTWGYHAYNSGKDIAMIQSILNHSSPVITLRYIGIDQDSKDKFMYDFTYKL